MIGKYLYLLLFSVQLYRTIGFRYDLDFRNHLLDEGIPSTAAYVSAADAAASYNTHAADWPFYVDVPTNETGTDCVPYQETGSGHHPSCNITSLTLGIESTRQIIAEGTIGDSGETENVCIQNGGFSCAAAYFETTPFGARAGERVHYSYNALSSSGENYYEFLVLVVNASSNMPIWGKGQRGIAGMGNETYEFAEAGDYYLRFYVGGYLFDTDTLPRELYPDITFAEVQIEENESRSPTEAPSLNPTASPSRSPSLSPSSNPTSAPSSSPTSAPSSSPSTSPSLSPTHSPVQLPCPPGRYRTNQGACIPCPINRFSDTADATRCERCPPGYFTNNTTESTSCLERPYSRVSHLPNVENVTTECLPAYNAALSDNTTAYDDEVKGQLSLSQAALCIREFYESFVRRSTPGQPPERWGAPAIRTFPTGLLRSQASGTDVLGVGPRARLVEIPKPDAEVTNLTVPCVCDSVSTDTCLKKLYFTTGDPFAVSPPAEWSEYRSGLLVQCVDSQVVVDVSFLPFSGGSRRRLQFGSDDPIHSSNSGDQTEAPTLSPITGPSSSPTVSPSDSPTPLPNTPPTTTVPPVSTPARTENEGGQPFETSILAIMLYTMGSIVILVVMAYVVYNFYMISQESTVAGITEPADLADIVGEFVQRFREP